MADDSLYEKVGFDYAKALRELLERLTYEEVARSVGYRSTGSVTAICYAGRIPSHRHGEAIWALYCDTFKRKPPLILQEKKNPLPQPADRPTNAAQHGPPMTEPS